MFKYSYRLIGALLMVLAGCGESDSKSKISQKASDPELKQMILSLGGQGEIEGSSRGHYHVLHTDLTRRIMLHRDREAAVQLLVGQLESQDLFAAIYAAFLLGEMKAHKTRAALESACQRKMNVEDMRMATLRLQAKYALEKIDGKRTVFWKPSTNSAF